jgi:hypothetical protein
MVFVIATPLTVAVSVPDDPVKLVVVTVAEVALDAVMVNGAVTVHEVALPMDNV